MVKNLMLMINDYLKQLFVDTPFEQGTTNQKISIGNFSFKNDNNTKFVNIEKKIDYRVLIKLIFRLNLMHTQLIIMELNLTLEQRTKMLLAFLK